MPAMNPLCSTHAIAIDLSHKRQNIGSHRAESYVMDIDHPLNRTRLVRTLEISGDPISVLCDLDVLYFRLAVPGVRGVNRPVTFNVVRRMLGQRGLAKNQRHKSKTSQAQCRVHSLHDILLFGCDLLAAYVACKKNTGNDGEKK